MTIHPIDVIQHKRDGLVLSDAEIHAFIGALVDRRSAADTPTDAQAAALLMAILIRGLNPQELAALTQAMRFSGETLDTSSLGAFTVDKHSTGGVGDKASLLIAPIVAAAGLYDPMISGRSLGHTGGTLDKLETIPGFRTQLPLAGVPCNPAPVRLRNGRPDPHPRPRRPHLYALRDHTGTVESPYLITASIMSKKLAAGFNALVLDVKTGSGAFIPRYADAQAPRPPHGRDRRTRRHEHRRATHLHGSAPRPLLRQLGRGAGVPRTLPALRARLRLHSAARKTPPLIRSHSLSPTPLTGQMLHLGGKAADARGRRHLSAQLLANGSAYQRFLQMVALQTSPLLSSCSEQLLSSRSEAEGRFSHQPRIPLPRRRQPRRLPSSPTATRIITADRTPASSP